MRTFRVPLILLCLIFQLSTVKAAGIELDSIIAGAYRPEIPSGWQSMNEGSSYACLAQGGKLILRYDYKSGKLLDTLLNVEKTRNVRMEKIEGFEFNPQESMILVWKNKKPIWRRSFTAEYFVYDRLHNILDSLSAVAPVREASFSPDGRMVVFSRNNNLFIKKLDFKTEVAVSTDGKTNEIINGTADWVYEEEFMTTRMYEWTADSKFLCFVRFDERSVPEHFFSMYGASKPEYPEYKYHPGEKRFRYPRSGENNSKVSLHCYNVQYRTLQKIELPVDEETYIPRLRRMENPDLVAVMTLNKKQNLFRMFTANPKSLLSRLILSESSDTYYDPSYLDDILFTDKDFTYVSERDGYRHLYLYSVNGAFIRQLTSGPNDLTNYYGRDLRKNYFYYQAVDDLPYRRSLYRVDARGRTTKLSDKDGINQAVFDKHFNYCIWTWSDRNTPPVSVLCQSDNAKVISTLKDNAALRQKLSALSLPQKEFFETPAADGQKLYGWMLKPAGFDPSLRYPLVMLQYSGPDSQDVLDLFGIGWEYYLAARGIIVVSVDGRGTGGRGEQFRKQTWLKLGQYEVQDQIAAARALGTLPYVDAARIGIWGWSYGAYISLLALTEGTQYFKAGIAVAPVTDYRYYNTAYTERFMRTPQQNKENYDKTSVLQRASSLKGELLLIHGLADDNVHANQTMELIDALVQEGKQFQMQLYPNRNHSILGLSNRKHLYTRMSDFFIQTLNADK